MQISSIAKKSLRYTYSCVTTAGTFGSSICSLLNIQIYNNYDRCGWGVSIFAKVPFEISSVQQDIIDTFVNKNCAFLGACFDICPSSATGASLGII